MTRDDQIKAAFEDPGTFASCILLLLVDRFGTEVIGWEPATIEMELTGAGINAGRLLSDKINAALALMGTDLYFKSIDGFNAVNTAFNFKPVDTRSFDPLPLSDIMWGVTEAKFIMGPEDYNTGKYSHDVAIYVGVSLTVEGMTKPPAMLGFAEFDQTESANRDQALMNDKSAAEAYWQRQDETGADINAATSAKLLSLMQQLKTLPLRHKVPELEHRIEQIINDIAGDSNGQTGTEDQVQGDVTAA